MTAATEPTRHILIHTHNAEGKEVFQQFRHPETDVYTSLDLDEIKAGAAILNKKHKPHKFAAYTLVKR